MADPKNYREVDIKLDGIEKTINAKFEGLEGRLGLIRRLVWTMVGFLPLLVGGAFFINQQIAGLRKDIDVISDRVARIQEDTKEIRADAKAARSDNGQIFAALQRIEARDLRRDAGSPMTQFDGGLIRGKLGMGPSTGKPGKIQIGDKLDLQSTKPFPDDLQRMFAQLKDLRFVVDEANNGLVVVDAGSGRVVGVF